MDESQEWKQPVSRIFIYQDKEGASRIWQRNFLEAAEELGSPAVAIAFDHWFDRPKSPAAILRKIARKYRPGDKFVARFNERRELRFKKIYAAIEQIFGTGNIFPDRMAVDLYNDKRRQAEFFQASEFPAPVQGWIRDEADLGRFMADHRLAFPVVRKESRGAASAGVSLIDSPDTTYPFVAQEFCSRNEGDVRVMVVGRKVFGFARGNRPDDFRASGSGKIDYVSDLPADCVETAYRISQACGFICMAYDFIRNNREQWVVAELSYTFLSEPPSRCRYYYDAEQDFARIDRPVGKVERLILESMIVRSKDRGEE